MISIRSSADRGYRDHGWLEARHTFSFGDFHDPQFNRFRSLRVMNEDRVQPGGGFGMHSHRDMEIITYVLSGQIEQRDSMDNGGVLNGGELQYMCAGTGIMHSEFNPSTVEPVHLYQIWLLPHSKGLQPSYRDLQPSYLSPGTLQLLASPGSAEAAFQINQDVRLFRALLNDQQDIKYAIDSSRALWVQIVRGEVRINGISASSGDGAAVTDETHIELHTDDTAELLLFDLK